MLENSLIISYSTPNYSKLTEVFLNSLKNLGNIDINHLIDNPPENLLKVEGFQTDLWYYCVFNKIKHLINVLKNHLMHPNKKYFIFCDCDIWFIRNNFNEWKNLEKNIIDENNDIFFMREQVSDDINSGFFIIKNNNRIENVINFFVNVLNVINNSDRQDMPFGDQTIINNLKTQLNYGFISNDYVIYGPYIFNKSRSLFHHAVFCSNIEEKLIQINNVKVVFENLKTNIVVSRYKKNVDWVYKINGNINKVLIYDKENPDNEYNVPINKGNEASVYLKYIVDHYDVLPEYTFFVHDEEYAWHHSGSIIDKYNEAISSNKLYYNINDGALMSEEFIIIAVHSELVWNYFWLWYDVFIEPYIKKESLPNIDFTRNHRAGAQFLVHRDLIVNLPKCFYENLYNWIIITDLDNSLSGRFLEWTWHVFWDIYPN
jgi:hypothetical protein